MNFFILLFSILVSNFMMVHHHRYQLRVNLTNHDVYYILDYILTETIYNQFNFLRESNHFSLSNGNEFNDLNFGDSYQIVKWFNFLDDTHYFFIIYYGYFSQYFIHASVGCRLSSVFICYCFSLGMY
jgi:hypothetical protein